MLDAKKTKPLKQWVNQANMTNTTVYIMKGDDRKLMYRCLDGNTVEFMDRSSGKWVVIDRSESFYYNKDKNYREY